MARTVTIVNGASTTVTLVPGQVAGLLDDAGVILTDDAGATVITYPGEASKRHILIVRQETD